MDTRAVEELAKEITEASLSRRAILKLGAALPVLGAPFAAFGQSGNYRVGAAVGPSVYDTTSRAIEHSAEWPDVAGRVVVIKPNLVIDEPGESGIVTDSEVTRAAVDRALDDGAELVLIVETGPSGANFDGTGYRFFETYGNGNRVALIDLRELSVLLTPNPSGWIYKQLYVADLLTNPDIIFINIAKLKTHVEARVTLTSKNLFGIPNPSDYVSPRIPTGGRFAMHDRGVAQSVYDLNVLRPSDFNIIDGIWGMEGKGPILGDPIQVNTVIAGRNGVAVDRVGLEVMQVPQYSVRHLTYLSLGGHGPWGMDDIDVVGDPLPSVSFVIPQGPPEFDPPKLSPRSVRAGVSQTTITTRFMEPCFRKVEVVAVSDLDAKTQLVRTVAPLGYQGATVETLTWDGRDDNENDAPVGRYSIRVTAWPLDFGTTLAAATSWVQVI